MEEEKPKLNDREWSKLLQKIEKEKVVLILGDELSVINVDGKTLLLKDYLLDKLVDALNEGKQGHSTPIKRETVKSFIDISYDYKKEWWHSIKSDPYEETTEILANIPRDSYETTALKKLLSIDKFKTIVTTSFDDTIYNVLKDIYGDSNILRRWYEKGTTNQDIPSSSDKIVLYHLFGKSDFEPHSFVLTEDDLLDYIRFLTNDIYRPVELSNALSDKYILIVGCSYPDWLFRFFFHTLKSSFDDGDINKGLLADHDLDPDLVSFLRRKETSVHDDAIDFIDELCDRWQKRNPAISDSESIDGSEDSEAFISYAKEDFDMASKIADIFKNMGLKVWFDKKDLEIGDKYEKLIEDKINNKIKTFIPILSPNTAKEDGGGRFYRREWQWAKHAEGGHYGTNDHFIRPLLINGYTMDNSHVFNDCHYEVITDSNIEEVILRVIRSIRKK